MVVTIFWSSLSLLVYIYFGYPFLVRNLAKVVGVEVEKRAIAPRVTVVVTAYNEERGIRSKLDNIVGLNYPKSLLEVIVASDGSTDRTDSLVEEYEGADVRLLRVEGRRGKTACQNIAVESATGEIVVFTDATTRLAADAVGAIVANFADQTVGCVAGCLKYEARGLGLTGEGGTEYWQYEIGLRSAESALGSLVGVSGCLYAIRRQAYSAISPSLISDFVIALHMRERNLRTVLEPRAVCFEDTLERPGSELGMRVRVGIRSINALVTERRFLNPFRFGIYSWQLWSHKALRYASPLLWMVAICANALLYQVWTYRILFLLQMAFLALGLLGFRSRQQRRSARLLRKPYYFLLTNLASMLAIVRYMRGDRMITWKPVR